MTANADSRYQMLLQVAAGSRLREDTAALNMTYTASVTAVEIDTPSANHGSKCATFTLLFGIRFPYDVALSHIVPYRPRKPTNLAEAGIDLVTLAAMLGHSKINLVLRYTRATQEHQTKATEMMERFVTEQQIAFVEHSRRRQVLRRSSDQEKGEKSAAVGVVSATPSRKVLVL
jgi:hypothetical protein